MTNYDPQRDSEANFRALVEAVEDYAIFRLDPSGHIVTWNNGAERIKGYRASEILGRHFSCFYPPEELETGKPALQLREAINRGSSRDQGWRLRKDGSRFWANVVLTALLDESGRLHGFVKVTQDISERKLMEDTLRQREETLDAFFRASPVGLAIMDKNLCFERVNGTLAAINGASPEDHLGKTITGVVPGLASAIEPRMREVLRTGEPLLKYEVSGRMPSQNGEIGYWEANYFPIRNESGEIEELGCIVLDITDCRWAEDSLRRLSGRLMEIQDQDRRRIARELHDSIGQCLTAIKMNIEIFSKDIGPNCLSPRGRNALEESLKLSEQCLADTRTISYILHPPLLDERGVASAIRWYADGFAQRSGIELTLELPADGTRLPQPVETTLFRIVQECLANIHRHAESPKAEIRLLLDAEEAILEVRDEGRGMSRSSLDVCNGHARALGVGIAGMRERVRQLHGQLGIQSSSKGTIVTSRLPLGGEHERFSHSDSR